MSIVIAAALISVLIMGVTLFGGALDRKTLQENNDMQKEIVEGQKEIIRLLKALGAGA